MSELMPAGETYWRKTADGYSLFDSEGVAIVDLPANATTDHRAMAWLDFAIPKLEEEQRATFTRLLAAAPRELDPWAFVGIVPMIRRGMAIEQLAKYVGVKDLPEEANDD